ncbi:MAG: dTDP-4-dehydrorhamnose 3,5-epimerase [Candidatus Omnitrophica bacterium]|nr:dTDP-4-dehydrorhamnose 3,5-epimerase [Candidatus Omnitrophota bacterium]
MKFTHFAIPGPILVEPQVHEDPRGAFWEWYRKDLYAANGIREEFVQDNESFSVKGVLRGLHWQVEPKAQAKLIRVVRGEIFDAAVDVRPGSSSFGRWIGQRLTAASRQLLYLPPGFAHGFLVLSDEADVLYKVSALYDPALEQGLLWNDPEVGIRWPDVGMAYLVSEKDKKNPPLKKFR